MLLRLVAFITLCLVCSCEKNKEETPPSSITASTIPKVAFASIQDHAKHSLDWNVLEELSELIFERFKKQETFAVVKTKNLSKQLSLPLNFDHLKEVLHCNDFVVFMELIEHQEILKESSRHLEILLRLQVIDLRELSSNVILREVIHDSHFMPNSAHFTQVSWKEEGYEVSPIGMAHLHFAKKVARRIEDIIHLTKT